MVHSPGPHMIILLLTKSRITRFFFMDWSPKSGGKLLPSITGASYLALVVLPRTSVMLMGTSARSKARCEPVPTPLTFSGLFNELLVVLRPDWAAAAVALLHQAPPVRFPQAPVSINNPRRPPGNSTSEL